MTGHVLPVVVMVVPIVAAAACLSFEASSLESGRALYAQNGCANCHGAGGHGDGPMAKTLEPRPRDFRDAASFKQGTDATSVAATIAAGVPEGGKMPRFEHLSQAERRSLALFVISLRDRSEKRTD